MTTEPTGDLWSARCGESRTAGAGSGAEKRTGWKTGTALRADFHLAARLGPDQVTSVEIDEGVTGRAIEALRRLGRVPHVTVGDAAAGSPGRAPFDRIIATVAMPQVPAAWLAQTCPGALLLVPLLLAGHGGVMVLLERDEQGGAQGRVLEQYGGFMATRATALPGPPVIRQTLLDRTQCTSVPVNALGGSHPASFFVSLLVSPFRTLGFTPDGSDRRQTWGRGLDGSTFVMVEQAGEYLVAFEGPLWGEIESAYRQWLDLGRPDRSRVGVTVGATGEHDLWLDDRSTQLRRWPDRQMTA